MFCACAPLSAAVFDDTVMEARKARSHKDLFNRLFGPGDEHWKQNNVLKILSDWDQNNLPKIRYYIDCGDDDGLLDGNMQVHQIMRQKGSGMNSECATAAIAGPIGGRPCLKF